MRKPPEPLYPCHFCSDEYSWPASDLHWSNRFSDWVCGECWCGNCHDDDYEPDEMGARLSDYLKDTTEQELVTLRAKAKAYDEGDDTWAIYDLDGVFVVTDSVEPDTAFGIELTDGYTCSKVRVCREVENEKGKE